MTLAVEVTWVPNRQGGQRAGRAPVADPRTLSAFVALVILGGGNAVAVRFSNLELPPFWGAASRFVFAAVIFWVILLVSRTSVPRGRALVGAVLYGTLAMGASYAFIYWGILRVSASLTMVVLSLNPLLTLLFAAAHRLERFRWRGLAGALIALAGIAVAVGPQLGRSVPLSSLLAVIAGAACIAEGAIVFKLLHGAEPIAANAIGATSGALLLMLVSLMAGERWFLPSTTPTIAAFVYLVVAGSVLVFYFYLYVLSRWTASATSYSFLLFPIATVVIASVLTEERVTLAFAAGSAFALLGVWLGAIARPRPAPGVEGPSPPATELPEPPCPGCA